MVLLLAVAPLALPMMRWPFSSQCVAQMTMEHVCCPQHSVVATPTCCNAKTDASLPERKTAASETRQQVASKEFVSMLAPRLHLPLIRAERHAEPIPILLPTLILRT